MKARNTSPFFWARFDDEKLLGLKLRELGLREFPAPVATAIAEVRQELRRRGLRVELHFWWAREWFSPDGIPGVAIPFYLAHPRLARLERRQVWTAEGSSAAALRKILRHEAGHAVMNAFALRGNAEIRSLFGDSATPYPESYRPLPHSRRFVRHLGQGYAQSHPDEDFAETFAVWLGDKTAWRARYAGWPALAKLEAIDRLMRQWRGRKPVVRQTRRVEPLEREAITLRQHYAERRRQLRLGTDRTLDRLLYRMFSRQPADMTAERFLRKIKAEVAREAATRSGRPRYEADRVVDRLIRRSRELDLAIPPGATRDLTSRISTSARRLLQNGDHPIFM